MSAVKQVFVNGYHLEYRWIGPPSDKTPVLIFLHEGLGCVSLWRDFPDLLAEKTGLSALVYSRAGYGKSDPVTLPRPIGFMHDEAYTLKELLACFSIENAILIGHSDGASIALIHAGKNNSVGIRGLILEAPHVFVEKYCLENIAKVKETYHTTDLPERLRKHHGNNTECAFWGWNDVWLDPAFKSWNIEEYLSSITIPVLLIQGLDDEYGTMEQIEAVKRQVRGPVDVKTVDKCGHSPHREFPEETLKTMRVFINDLISSE